MTKLDRIILLFILFAANIAFATNLPLYKVSGESLMLNDFEVGLIIDSNRNLSIDQISQIREMELVNSRFTITSIEEDYWFVFNIENTSTQSIEQIVGFDEAFMESADLYYRSDSGWHYEQNGVKQPINKRVLKNRCPVFQLTLAAGETKTVFLKIHSKFTGVIGVFIADISEFAKQEQLKIMGYWGYFGASIAILLYNLFLLFFIRERLYLYYIINVFCIIIFTFLYSGFSSYLISDVNLFYDLHVSSSVMGFFLTLFTRELLKPQLHKKWIGTVLNAIAWIYAILSVLILVDISYYQLLVVFAMPSMLFLLFTGIYSLRKKTPLTSFYIVAMGAYLLGLFMIAAVTMGWLPFNSVTRYGFLFGSFIELSVFSLALAYRIRLLQEDKIVYQSELIESEKSIKSKLEKQVALRTEDLVHITKKLKASNEELALQIQEKNNVLDALKESELELKAINDSKDKFFSIIAHDLKSPFNSILGFLDLLMDRYGEYNEKQRLEMLQSIHSGANHTYSLLENLLIWSRTQIGKIEYQPQSVELLPIITETIMLFKQYADEKEISIKVETGQIQNVMADRQMVSTIVRNIISNAIKFTHTGGKIHINSAASHENDRMAVVTIQDSGVGVVPENLEKLFCISNGISTLGTNNEKGTGLGLILCKEFVELHGGEIWAESEVGKGCVIHFTIPLS